MMKFKFSDHVHILRLLAVALLLVTVVLAHWLTPRGNFTFQGVHIAMRKLFILPIILAAVWFNLRGAVLCVLIATAAYLPHVFWQWRGQISENLNQVGEVLTMWGVALLAGWCVGQEKSTLRAVAQTHRGALLALIGVLDAREHDTELHSIRVRAYALRIARQMGLPARATALLSEAALLHDVGKIGIPDHILLKPGPLTEQELQLMRTHPQIGRQILQQVPFLRDVAEVVYTHHERYDGSGYPQGLQQKGIPLATRIFAVADTFDALTSMRPYHQAMDFVAARRIIQQEKAKHFDPVVVEAFMRIPIGQWRRITKQIHLQL